MKRIALFLFFCLALAATPSFADKGGDLTIEPKASIWYVGDADFEDGGSSSLFGEQISLGVEWFTLKYEGRHYSWDDKSDLDFGNGSDDPWDSLHRLSLGAEHRGAISGKWGYFTGVSLTSAFEEEMEDSFGASVRGGISYTYSEHLNLMFGARFLKNHIRTAFMPFAGLMYKDFDRSGAGYFVTLGAPNTEVGYAFSKASKIRLAFSIDGRTYRLSDDSVVSSEGYVETSAMQLGLYYDWMPIKDLSISLGPEYHFNRSMKFYDDDGDRIGDEEDQDSAAGFRLKLGYKF